MDDAVIAVFAHHEAADLAVWRLVAAGCDRAALSVVGRGCHTAEDVIAFHGKADRVSFLGPRGAFWGGLWGLFFGGLFMTFPGVGIVIVIGYLAATTALAVENETVADGFGMLGALLAGMGVPTSSAARYEAAVKADGFLVMAHGSADQVAHAKAVLGGASPLILDTHEGLVSSKSGEAFQAVDPRRWPVLRRSPRADATVAPAVEGLWRSF